VILLDTHVAVWSAFDTNSLGKKCRRIVRQALTEHQLAVSAISFWEIALLVAKRRMRFLTSAEEMRGLLLSTGITELPLTGKIAILAGEIQDLHADPADRFIAATAIAHDAMLITADERLLRWQHALRRIDAET